MDGNLLRILDANANRAREALRVMEDYARFCLNNDDLSQQLKNLRHGLAAATNGQLADAILWRDVEGDVGADNKTQSEAARADLGDIVTAAGKRLSEALRVIEEILKTSDTDAATRAEKLRYSAYTLEQKLCLTLRPRLFEHVRLYVLITESICKKP